MSISIHAAREGGDASSPLTSRDAVISIHAAREGGDGYVPIDTGRSVEFQSTPPVKAATICAQSVRLQDEISIHAAREGGDINGDKITVYGSISIHAAREGGDGHLPRLLPQDENFNPRRP